MENIGNQIDHNVPVRTPIRQALDEDLDAYMPRTSMNDAIGSSRDQWYKLTAYVPHGRTYIGDDLTEQAFHPTKLGAKPCLSIGHP